MKIRVAYDITLLGRNFGRVDPKYGISRVIEEVLCQLSHRNEVELTIVELFGDDPLLDSVNSYLCVSALQDRICCKFARSFQSRLGLGRLYQSTFSACLAKESEELMRNPLRLALMRRLRGLLYRLHYTYRIDPFYRTFDSEQYDVFHSSFPELPPETLTRSVPRVATVYDLIPVLAPEFVPPFATPEFRQRLGSINIERDWVTCISEHAKREFCEYTGMSPARAFVTPLAAGAHFKPVEDAEHIARVRQRYGIPEGEYFLSLAAPQPRKNLAHLIRCFFRLLQEHPALNMHLVLAGSKGLGWMYEDIFAAAEGAAAQRAQVLFTGYIADTDLSAIYSGAAAFVFPSLYEGFGLPPLEAMQCGTPVITSNTTALPEVVGGAGLMVDPHDEDALCQALLEVAQDEGLRRELRQKGLLRAQAFSWERCAEETVRTYKAAINE